MKTFLKRSLPLLLGVLSPMLAQADRERPFFQASRALGMGDAYTAYDVGYESVYYNPAGVARRNKAQAKYIDLEGTVSQGVFSVVKGTFSNLTSLGKFTQNLYANQGKVQSLGIALLPQFLIRNFSVGLVLRSYNEAYIDPTTANMDFFAATDAAVYVHTGVALFGGILKLGAGAKALNRAEINRTYTQAEYSSTGVSFSSQWKEGTGYGFDAGALLTYPSDLQPTLGVAVQDIGATDLLERRLIWTGAAGTPGAPPSLPQKVNVGLSISSKFSRGKKAVLALELKNVLKAGTNYTERIHAGMELELNRILFLRAGLNEGRYWTGGLGLHAGGVGLELTTYGENVSHDGGTRDDRKWIGRYVLAF